MHDNFLIFHTLRKNLIHNRKIISIMMIVLRLQMSLALQYKNIRTLWLTIIDTGWSLFIKMSKHTYPKTNCTICTSSSNVRYCIYYIACLCIQSTINISILCL